MGPNILWVIFDTARADALEPYGAPAGATPTVAQLARAGTALDRVYANASWTLPSHGSMFTGLLPRMARIGETRAERSETAATVRSQADRVLPEVLRRAGYATAAVSTNVWVSEYTGFDTGFDRFVLTDSGRQGRIRAKDLRSRLNFAKEAVRAGVDDGAAEAERVLERWIDEQEARQPFFWFVNLVECHSPYLPPRPYNDLGPIDRLRAGIEARRHLTLGAIWAACIGEFNIPEDALARMRHLYGRSVRYMDDWLTRLLERLDAKGVLRDTTVVVTSDHGENLGEGGLIAHACSLDDRLLHVPFVAAGPRTDVLPDRLVSLAELPRLTAEIAGLDSHPWRPEDLPRAGVNVAQLNPPVDAGDPRIDVARRMWNLDEAAMARLVVPFVCATDGRFKLIRRDGKELLHDLEADPLELEPQVLNGGQPAPAAQEALPRLREALDHPAAARRSDGAVPEEAKPAEPSEEETKAIEERMRLLGYL